MSETCVDKHADYVLSEGCNQKLYSVVLDDDYIGESADNCIIRAKNLREVELSLMMLREEVNVIMDEKTRKLYPDVWDWLYGRTYSEVLNALKWTYREDDETLEFIEKIPLPKTLTQNQIQISNNDPEPEPMDQCYAHKLNRNNVLISKPYICGSMMYFNGFNNSPEFQIDHTSDHMEGILIFETSRQSAMASVYLTGIPFTGSIVILRAITNYIKFVENGSPYIIRTLPVIKPKGGYSYVLFHIIQDDHTCATGCFNGFVCRTKEAYEKLRNTKVSKLSSK